ncbi:prostaglandin F synthase 1-like [Oppia nitens]|uniref:prostaglandin F synthase 1-like n=1 Tax=Oppia nitens TaxID=1686743 RepID=UPI0023DA3279|nr:prostaglandin F synthase 1-like [Oppia nitens]
MYKLSLTLLAIILAFKCISADIPTRLLNNGQKIPIVGLGAGHVTEESVRSALEVGYRHIDTSLNYGDSEIIIGKVLKEVLKDGKIKRQDLYIVSKLETEYHTRSRVPEGIKKSLQRLDLDYLDLYLIHSPDSQPANITVGETWLGMIDVLKANLTRSIGVSNFNQKQLDEVIAKGVVPVTNQVICNPYVNERKLLAYADSHNVTLTAYSPVGGRAYPDLLKDPKLIEIGNKYKVSSAQVALRFEIQRGVIAIPNSQNPKYIKENIDVFGFKLTDEDIKAIEALNKKDS